MKYTNYERRYLENILTPFNIWYKYPYTPFALLEAGGSKILKILNKIR